MLMDIQIEGNKSKFIELLSSINRENMMKDQLINKLTSSDFFIAPASTKYHQCYKGGLCKHSLDVYNNLISLNNSFCDGFFNEDSLKIVGLLHDMAKMNYYEVYYQNKKEYSPDGSKYDEGGRYDWKAVSAYKVKDVDQRFVFGNHEQTSEFMVRTYIPLTLEESVAILNHHFGMGFDSTKADISHIADKYKLVTLLHIADMISAYII